MIRADDYLLRVTLNAEDSQRFKKTMAEIEEASEKHQKLTGFYIQVHPGRIPPDGELCRALQIALQKDGWVVDITLHPSELNKQLPGFWRITVIPNEAAYNNAMVQLADDSQNVS